MTGVASIPAGGILSQGNGLYGSWVTSGDFANLQKGLQLYVFHAGTPAHKVTNRHGQTSTVAAIPAYYTANIANTIFAQYRPASYSTLMAQIKSWADAESAQANGGVLGAIASVVPILTTAVIGGAAVGLAAGAISSSTAAAAAANTSGALPSAGIDLSSTGSSLVSDATGAGISGDAGAIQTAALEAGGVTPIAGASSTIASLSTSGAIATDGSLVGSVGSLDDLIPTGAASTLVSDALSKPATGTASLPAPVAPTNSNTIVLLAALFGALVLAF